jgi:hypothetical protein
LYVFFAELNTFATFATRKKATICFINNKKNKNKKLVLSKDIENIIKNKDENINKTDNLKLSYLYDLEELKNKNESIIFNLQSDINNLVKEIESLSVDI